MSSRRKGPIRMAWRSTCATCNAFCQWLYSALVILLVSATLFAAYVATLDDIPVPNFIIRELQVQLKSQGLTLRMKGVRFQPNGRIIFTQPEIYSTELGSTIFRAEKAVAKIRLTHLAFGSASFDEVRLSSGEFVIPAMLTPSGEPVTAVSSINLEATQRGRRWNIDYANCAIDNLKLSIAGILHSDLLKLPKPKPDAPKLSASRAILQVAPKIAQLRKVLERFDSPFAIINLDVIAKRQAASLELGSRELRIAEEFTINELLIQADLATDETIGLELTANSVQLPYQLKANSLQLYANWDSIPDKLQPYPFRIQASSTNLSYQDVVLPSLVASASPRNTYYQANLQLTAPTTPIEIDVHHYKESKKTTAQIRATFDQDSIDFVAPVANSIAPIESQSMISSSGPVDLQAKIELDSEFKPLSGSAYGTSGPIDIMGAAIDFAALRASLDGPQISVPEIRLRSGLQAGVIKIGYNLETMLRRIMVEGSFDPTMINDWFKPWWSAMWNGMTFPEEGMLTYLDSQAIFKQPDTVRVTGLAYAQDIDVRGLDVRELRTKIFSLYHYVDLYDMQLAANPNQHARGEIQFHMGRDLRDEKDKLTGIWIQAISTLDVKKAPDILWEISDAAASILAPYCYDIPPLIEAKSGSVRHLDEYINEIELDIETFTPFSYYGFPFDSLETSVYVGDDTVDLPLAQGKLGDGNVNASIFVVGDGLALTLDVDQANFGEVLNAANTYFAVNGSATAQQMDTERLLNYGGKIDAFFDGAGIAGEPTSFEGVGEFAISDADFGKFQLFGLLSMALEITPLRFTTLKFTDASGAFTVDRELVRFENNTVEGPVATIESSGRYNIETEALNFAAKLFPFRNSKVPLISPIINIPLNIVSNVFEVYVTGTFSEPQLRLTNPKTDQQIDVDPSRNPRDSRPAPRR